MTTNIGDLPGANPLTPATVKFDLPGGQSIELDASIAAFVKSIDIEMVVTRANGTVEAPIILHAE